MEEEYKKKDEKRKKELNYYRDETVRYKAKAEYAKEREASFNDGSMETRLKNEYERRLNEIMKEDQDRESKLKSDALAREIDIRSETANRIETLERNLRYATAEIEGMRISCKKKAKATLKTCSDLRRDNKCKQLCDVLKRFYNL